MTHDTVRAVYPLTSITEALARLINAKQQENEFLLDFVKRFKQLRDLTKSQLGTKLLDEYVEKQQEFKDESNSDKKDEMKKNEYEKWMAYMLMRGTDQNRYGSLMKGLSQQYSLGNDQYPKTITAATDVLSNHKLE